ncbi:MAG: DUF1097 domain-containing protein [Oscillospiraceae bacterium]
MTAKKYLPIALFIGLQACVLQILDQLIGANVPLVSGLGFGWVSFQAWAVYFFAGCTPKDGIRAFIGYVLGMLASMAILAAGGALGGTLGFWSVPLVLLVLVPIILYLDIAPQWFNCVPALFVGAGVFFGCMTYVPGATFTNVAIAETLFCVIGLFFGFLTIAFRHWYEGKYVTPAETADKK